MPPNETTSTDWPSRVYWIITVVVGTLGAVLVVRGLYVDLTVREGGDASQLVGPGATLLTAVLAGLVTRASFVTWQAQRRRNRETLRLRHQEEVYEKILKHMIARFVGSHYDIEKDGELRASAAVWADRATIRALGAWQDLISEVLAAATGCADGSVSLDPAQSESLKESLADVVLAMRADLQGSDLQQPTRGEVLASIFNRS